MATCLIKKSRYDQNDWVEGFYFVEPWGFFVVCLWVFGLLAFLFICLPLWFAWLTDAVVLA